MAAFLLVEDNASEARSLKRLITQYAATSIAPTVSAALAEIGDAGTLPALAGAIVDIHLPDGCGLDVIDALRKRTSHLPIMVLTGTASYQTCYSALQFDTQYQRKPIDPTLLGAFVTTALIRHDSTREARERALVGLRTRWRLTRAECEVVDALLEGNTRAEMATLFGVSENAVKWRVKSLLRKAEAKNLREIEARLRCESRELATHAPIK